jgi:hypothetical protein
MFELEVIERCRTFDNNTDKPGYGIRIIRYKTDFKEVYEALADFYNNFDLDKVVSSYDSFEGECCDSLTISAEVIKN